MTREHYRRVTDDWIGDDGILRRLNVEVCRFNLLGDLITCRGRVTGKELVQGEALVHLEIVAERPSGAR